MVASDFSRKCFICGSQVDFQVEQGVSLRESRCPVCHGSKRSRDLAKVIVRSFLKSESLSLSESLAILKNLIIYEAAASGPIHNYLSLLPHYTCSEYFDNIPPGTLSESGIRCEDLENLTFQDHTFDLVITQDVFEHIKNPRKAFLEINRVLKVGGYHIFTIPLHEGKKTIRRVSHEEGRDIFILPPVLHDDPIRDTKSLVRTDFGDDIIDYLNSLIGFTEVAWRETFYPPERIPWIMDETTYQPYLRYHQKGELLRFFLYNSVVLKTAKKKEGPLEWTGERYVPWMEPGEIHYEHLHRYRFAKEFVKGKKVLDLACGEGYGSNLLAEDAEQVVGIDIDEVTIRHASSKYLKENLSFIVGSITGIPIEGERLFDVVVCFEGLEHIEQHDEFMEEVKRMLREDGIFIVSTPNRNLYSDQPHYQNPFHLRELYLDEFKRLLKDRFKHILLYGQQVYATSNLFSLFRPPGPTHHFVIEKKDREFVFVHPDMRKAKYFIAVASDASLDVQRAVGDSYLLDGSESLFLYRNAQVAHLEGVVKEREKEVERLTATLEEKEKQRLHLSQVASESEKKISELTSRLSNTEIVIQKLRETNQQKEKEASALREISRQRVEEVKGLKLRLDEKIKEVSDISEWSRQKAEEVKGLKSRLDEKTIEMTSLSEALFKSGRLTETLHETLFQKDIQISDLEHQIDQKESTLSRLTRTIDIKQGLIDSLTKDLEEKALQLSQLEAKIQERESTLISIYDSHGWKALLKYYQLRNTILPPHSKRSRISKFVFNRVFWPLPPSQQARPQIPPRYVGLPARDQEIKISVIIVHYSNERLTIDCIRSLLGGDYPHHLYEIILVNNGTDADYSHFAEEFHGQSNVHVLNPGKNLGFAGGCNFGIRASHGESILLLNNDTLVPKNFLADYVSIADAHRDFAILGTKIRLLEEEGLINNAGGFLTSWGDGGDIGYRERDIGQYDYKREVFSICAANMCIRREVFDQIGLLDERFFLYYEDVDFCYRARLYGLKVLYVPEPSILHHHAASSGEWSDLFTFYVFRNKLFLHLKNSNAGFLIKVVALYFAKVLKEVFILRTRQRIHLQIIGSLIKNLPYLLWSRLKIRLLGKKVQDSFIFNYVDKIPKRRRDETGIKDIVIYNRYLDTLGGGELSTVLFAKGLSDIFKGATIHILTFNKDVNDWGRTKVRLREDLERAFNVKLCDRVIVHRIMTFLETRIKRTGEQGVHIGAAGELLLKTHLRTLNWKLQRRARKSDLFLNHSFADEFILKAKESVYLCMFPHPPHQRDFMGHYTKVVGISEFTVKHINQRWHCKADLLYPFAFDVAPGYRDFSRRENLIINIGRFFSDGHNKRQDIVIQAFKGLRDEKKIDGWRLILIGRCAKKDEWFLEKMKEDAQGYDITFLTELSENKKIDLMEKAKIFVHATGYGTSDENFPERMEHFGISVVEAKIHGLVPIVIGKGGLKELVHHGQDGLLFDDMEDLTEKISMCVKREDLLRTLSINAYNQSIQKFDYATYLEYLRRILGR